MASGDYFEVLVVYLELVLLFTLKIHLMLRLIEISLIRLSDLEKEGRIQAQCWLFNCGRNTTMLLIMEREQNVRIDFNNVTTEFNQIIVKSW